MHKRNYLSNRIQLIAGVDEVGCGSLAGPVVAAAVIFHPDQLIYGLFDSKSLCKNQRLYIYKKIVRYALIWSIGYANVIEIDQFNILNARLLAMRRAIDNLSIKPDLILVDGNCSPKFKNVSHQCFCKGDTRISVIGAASIIAKVVRDHDMIMLDVQYPKYGFLKHKGYPTVFHLQQLKLYGPILLHHRKSFFPIKNMI